MDDEEPDNIELHGVDFEGPISPEESSQVEVMPPHCTLLPDLLLLLQQNVDPLRESEAFGIDLYLEALTLATSMTHG